jgi:predicted RNA-binding protein with RPS1 domain
MPSLKEASGRLDRRGRSQERDRIRPVHRPRRRHRRHGPHVRYRLGRLGRGSAGASPQGRDRQGAGARHRRREGAHQPRHQAARARRCFGRPVARGGAGGVNKGAIVTVTVLAVRDGGLDVQVGDDGATGFIKRSDLGRDRDEQRPERFQVGQKFDAMVIGFDRSKKPTFSVKAMQIAEEKQAVRSTVRPTRARRWATSSVRRSRARQRNARPAQRLAAVLRPRRREPITFHRGPTVGWRLCARHGMDSRHADVAKSVDAADLKA